MPRKHMGESQIDFHAAFALVNQLESRSWRTAQALMDEGSERAAQRELGAGWRERTQDAYRECCHLLARAGAWALSLDDPAYPEMLRQIKDPPLVLYGMGRIPEDPRIAMVGSRSASSYGREATRMLAAGLAGAGVCIVSGLALGIDAEAHRASLDLPGRTLAVLGSGIDVLTPRTNARLAQRILDAGGGIITEFAPGTRAWPANFPRRNRIITGLCLATIVVEARPGSGSLISARLAADQGREVLAVPGSILAEGSRGTNQLLADGASPALSPEDVLRNLQQPLLFGAKLEPGEAAQGADDRDVLDADARSVLDVLEREGQGASGDLRARCGIAPEKFMQTVAELELLGYIRLHSGMLFPAGVSHE